MAFYGTIKRRDNRVWANCKNCLWSSCSTGPQAERRVLTIIKEHRCQPVPVTFKCVPEER